MQVEELLKQQQELFAKAREEAEAAEREEYAKAVAEASKSSNGADDQPEYYNPSTSGIYKNPLWYKQAEILKKSAIVLKEDKIFLICVCNFFC